MIIRVYDAGKVIEWTEDGNPKRMIGTFSDITERKKLERDLIQSHKMQAIGQLTGGIAHDFNNMLASILGYSELTRENLIRKGDDKLVSYMNSIIEGSQRASKLVEKMQTFSRTSELSTKVISIAPIIQATMTLLKGSLPSSIEINLNIDVDVSPVLIDPIQLEQIVMNLCINARDAMHEVGTLLVNVQSIQVTNEQKHIPDVIHEGERIDVCFCQDENVPSHTGRYVEVSVRDSGSGISKEQLGRIFEPFYTTKEVGKGTGMGLATIHGIMNGANGHIIVESKEYKGTVFRMLFKINNEIMIDESELSENKNAKKQSRNAHILVVDDEESVANYLTDLLSSQGYQVEKMINSEEALALFLSSPDKFDLTCPLFCIRITVT